MEDLMIHRSLRNFTAAQVRATVVHSDKKRFDLVELHGKDWVRANQGHTRRDVRTEDISKELKGDEIPAVAVHGTYLQFFDSILATGLNSGNRADIHLSDAVPADMHTTARRVLAGYRADADVALWINCRAAAAAGVKFYRSPNGVVLSKGDAQRVIPAAFFLKAVVIRRGIPTAQVLWPHPVTGAGNVVAKYLRHAAAGSTTAIRTVAGGCKKLESNAFPAAAAEPTEPWQTFMDPRIGEIWRYHPSGKWYYEHHAWTTYQDPITGCYWSHQSSSGCAFWQ